MGTNFTGKISLGFLPNAKVGAAKKLTKYSKNLNSVAGTWTRVFRVRAEYPNQLDYNGMLTI